MLDNNEYVIEALKTTFLQKKYLARRITGLKALTISVFNSKSECMDEKFFKQYANFLQFKAVVVTYTYIYIYYHHSPAQLSFLLIYSKCTMTRTLFAFSFPLFFNLSTKFSSFSDFFCLSNI